MQLSYSFFALLSMTVLATVKANVSLHKGYAPVNPADDLHSFFVVGDRYSVSFTTQPNENGQESDLVCANIIPNSNGLGQAGGPLYAGPCEEDASKQAQVVVAQCVDKNDPKKQLSGKATITWYPSNSPDDQRKAAVHVETKGNVWVGTTTDPAKTPLIQGPFTLGGLPKASVLINCNNSSRTPIAN